MHSMLAAFKNWLFVECVSRVLMIFWFLLLLICLILSIFFLVTDSLYLPNSAFPFSFPDSLFLLYGAVILISLMRLPFSAGICLGFSWFLVNIAVIAFSASESTNGVPPMNSVNLDIVTFLIGVVTDLFWEWAYRHNHRKKGSL